MRVNEPTDQLLDDDRELRRAIKRVRGGHVADQALRSRIGAANNTLMAAMVVAHQHPGEAIDAQAIDAAREPAQIRDDLNHRLNRQPPTPDLRAAGWNLRAADIESLNGAVTARLAFANGPRNATLFSLPQFAFIGAEEDESYDIVVNDCPISGYITRDGVHCIVGDAGTPLSEITELRKRLQQM